MPRKSRITTETGSYHVMMRGNNRQNIFIDMHDRFRFLDFIDNILKNPITISGKDTGKFEIYAYALMPNHFHLLIKVISGELGDFMQRLASTYATYFNKKYKRDGHLFRGRFRSEVCEKREYFDTLLRYIHQNPIVAGLCTDLMKYQFTSWPEYMHYERYPYHICSVDNILERIPFKQLEAMVYEKLPDNVRCIDIDNTDKKISDESIIKMLISNYNITNKEEIQHLDKKEKKEIIKALLEYGALISQIHRLTGISKSSIALVNNNIKKEENKK